MFEPSWPGSAIDRTLTGQRWGWDYLGLYWGELLGEGVELGMVTTPWLRMAPTNLPRVRALGADVHRVTS